MAPLAVYLLGQLPREEVTEGGQNGLHRLRQRRKNEGAQRGEALQKPHEAVGDDIDTSKQGRVQRRPQLVLPFLRVAMSVSR